MGATDEVKASSQGCGCLSLIVLVLAVGFFITALGARSADDDSPGSESTLGLSARSGEVDWELQLWAAGAVGEINEGADLLAAIGDAAGVMDVEGVGEACHQLGWWALKQRFVPEAPDVTIRTHWNNVVELTAEASDLCVRGAATGSLELMEQSIAVMERIPGEVALAKAAIEAAS